MAKGQKTNLDVIYNHESAPTVLNMDATLDPNEIREARRIENDFAEYLGRSMLGQMGTRLLDYLIERGKAFHVLNYPLIVWNWLTERSVRIAYERGYKDAMNILLRRHVAIQEQLESSYPDYDEITEDETDPEKSEFAREMLHHVHVKEKLEEEDIQNIKASISNLIAEQKATGNGLD